MSKLKYLFAFVSLWLISFPLYSQSFYTADPYGTLRKESLTPSGLSSKTLSVCSSGLFSIAVSDNHMYFITMDMGLYKADLNDNGITNCTLLANISAVSTPYLPNALTVDRNGVLYFAVGNLLYKCDSKNPSAVYVGSMPAASGGDLIFYKDNLYLASYNSIYKINLSDPSLSTLEIAMDNTALYGLVSVMDDNYKVTVYALGSAVGTDMIELDLDNKKALGVKYNLPYTVYDGASDAEKGGPPPIDIQRTDIKHECDYYNRGRIEVITGPHTEVYTYTLQSTGENNTTGIFGNLQPGDYAVHVSTTTGVDPVDIPINIPDYSLSKPVITYTTKTPVCDLTGTLQFSMQGSSSMYSIRLGAEVFSFDHAFNLLPGYYSFTVLNKENCIVDTMRIDFTKVETCQPVSFPNTFTPNGDGINDIFRPNEDSRANHYQLTIFNRYGELLFTSKDLHLGWDGQGKGKSLPVGTYYWIATYTDDKGNRAARQGYVALIR